MRDFFYNKGDVFIAVLIILVALFVIYTRIVVIMDYSPTGERGGGLLPAPPSVGEVIDSITGGIGGGTPAGGGDAAAAENGAAGGAATAQEENPAQAGDTGSETPVQTENPPPSSSIQITVNAGDAASVIADKLLAAGAITDKQAFISDVIAQGADSKLKIGTFTIPAGASHSEIIAILVG